MFCRDVVGSRGEVVCSCCGQGAHRTHTVDPVVITGGTGHRRSGHESPSGIMAAKVPPKNRVHARTPVPQSKLVLLSVTGGGRASPGAGRQWPWIGWSVWAGRGVEPEMLCD